MSVAELLLDFEVWDTDSTLSVCRWTKGPLAGLLFWTLSLTLKHITEPKVYCCFVLSILNSHYDHTNTALLCFVITFWGSHYSLFLIYLYTKKCCRSCAHIKTWEFHGWTDLKIAHSSLICVPYFAQQERHSLDLNRFDAMKKVPPPTIWF